MLSKLVNITITDKQKAVAGFWIAAIGSYMAQNGMSLGDLTSWTAVKSLIVGVLTHQFVYWTTNRST